MKMIDQVLSSIFSKRSKYRRNEDGDERLPYLKVGMSLVLEKLGLMHVHVVSSKSSLFSPLMLTNISIEKFRRNILYPISIL
ncbi:hypothetical protein DPMN_078706 [Dreissena polymorpha]|uniref:Uncharacterized protein n=1 Tax=Dreissena polymorpha TaxID=45954 RepID=A0A9D4BHR3_DREPO|nr:hypothetical protein DPMN_078706 [Dreissena polymorpha]